MTKQVVVTTKQGLSIRGRKVFAFRGVRLVGAEDLETGKEMQGTVFIPRCNVALEQRL